MIGTVTEKTPGQTQIPPFKVDDDLLQAIKDIHHQMQFPDRTKALRAILEAGVVALREKAMQEKGKAPQA